MEGTSNWTTDADQPQTNQITPTDIFVPALLSVICVPGVLANGLVICVTGFKMKTTVNSVWFLNLALSDFICIFTLILIVISFFLGSWPFGNFLCKFIFLVRCMCMFTSIFLLTVISLDRWLTVWVPVWARNQRTPNKARLICVFVWLTSLVCSVPFSYYRRVVANQCLRRLDALVDTWLSMFSFVVGFVIPFLIITCCYVAIGVRASQIKREKKIRPFLVILAIILAFFISWLPFHVLILIATDQIYKHNIHSELQNSDLLNLTLKVYWVPFVLSLLHSCVNPILYMLMCEEFKQKLKLSVFLVLEQAFAD